MKVLSVFLPLCTIITLGRAYPTTYPPSTTYSPSITYPHNTTYPTSTGICEYRRQHCSHLIGSFCPQCDSNGNFLPQQCWGSTGHCWCVEVISGREIPNTDTPPGVPPVNCVRRCPPSWTKYEERCFKFINTPKKWIEAEVYCQFDGANLASVHSEEENHFIMSLTREETQNFPQTWLGGFDAIHPGYWMWSDGSDFEYENWFEENPVDSDEGNDHNDYNDYNDGHNGRHMPQKKNCLVMNYEYDLKWFHEFCTDSLPFVCAKKPNFHY